MCCVRLEIPAMEGAYGLRLPDIRSRFLARAPATWPELRIERRGVGPPPGGRGVGVAGDDPVPDGGGERGVPAGREPLQADFAGIAAIGDDELVHPYLSTVAAATAVWNGGIALHAGGFVHDGGAWA